MNKFPVIYKANQFSVFSSFKLWKNIIPNLILYKSLIKELLKADLVSEFKKSYLGQSWLIINPLINLVIWLLLKKSGIFHPGETAISYPLYLLLSLTLWGVFTGFCETIGNSITQNSRILNEVGLPMEVLAVTKILVTVVNFCISIGLCLIFIIISGFRFMPESLLFLPTLLPLFLFGISLGLILSLIEVIMNDVYIFFKRSLKILMYITPVVFSHKIESVFLQNLMKYNPLTQFIVVPRNFFLLGKTENLNTFFWHSAIVLICFFAVVQIYLITAKKLVEKTF